MEKENLYLIHGEDYLRHIEEKLELLWMSNVLMHYIKRRADEDSYLSLVYRATRDLDERCGELFSSWGKALNYLKSRDLADLSDLIENELIEPEYAGYVPADKPCCPGERCCEYAERIEREYAAKKDADEDMDVDVDNDDDDTDDEESDVFEYDADFNVESVSAYLNELLSVCGSLGELASGLNAVNRRLLSVVKEELRYYAG